VTLDDRKIRRTDIGPQPISDSEFFLGTNQSSGAKRLRCVICVCRLGSDHFYFRPHGFRRNARAGEQTATADRANHKIDIGNIFEQFYGCRPLPRHHIFVFKRVNQRRARCRNHVSACGFAGRLRRLAKHNMRTVTFDRAHLYLCRIRRHDDMSRDSA